MSNASRPLRAVTYLTPDLPLELFTLVCDELSGALGREIELVAEERRSGPMNTNRDPFAADEADIGFLCSPSFIYLRSLAKPTVELVPMGFVFEDMRIASKPVYFSEVVVRDGHPASTFGDLEDCVWGVNDAGSLSGCFSAHQKLRELGREDGFFAREVFTGSHLRSIEAILRKEIDGAAIDSNVFTNLLHECPELVNELRVIESWGPYPIQPIVVRTELAGELSRPLTIALADLTRDVRTKRRLAELGVLGFASTSADDYEDERTEMRSLGLIA